MRKITSMAVAVIMAISLIVPSVSAENNSDREQMQSVLENVKQRVEIPAECTEFDSEFMTEYGDTVYDFNWRNEDYSESVTVKCLSDGVITDYYCNGDNNKSSSPSIAKISKETALVNAEDFVKKLNPDFPYEIKIEDNNLASLYGNNYNFDVKVYVNGNIYTDGAGSVSVNKTTGEAQSFSFGYHTDKFPSLENNIGQDAAKKAYSEKLGLEMVYRSYTDDDGNDVFYPVYTQKYSYNKYINALTGEVEDISVTRLFKNSISGAMKEDAAAGDSGLSEQEIKELDNISGLMSKADFEKSVRGNSILAIPGGLKTDNINLRKYKDDDYYYSMSMSDGDTFIYVSADAKTGEIMRYSRYGENSEADRTCENNDSFKALAGDKAGEYRYNAENERYERYVNSVRVEQDSASVVYEGDILTDYYIAYSDAEFPSVEDAMDKEEAEKIMFDHDGYELVYMDSYGENEINIVPVYVHREVLINPFTGKYVNYRNEEVTGNENKIEYNDINGHYAEKYISELAYYGVGFEGGEFRPDDKITQKEFLSLLTAVYSGGIVVLRNDKEQADYVYGTSVRNNILSEDERNDDANVTRDMASVMMIRAMGAEEYAKYDSIYLSPFTDVTEHKGYSALLYAMGVVGGDGSGKFNPQKEITRAESAVMIYNYLTR